jgi:hypothetical protein
MIFKGIIWHKIYSMKNSKEVLIKGTICNIAYLNKKFTNKHCSFKYEPKPVNIKKWPKRDSPE